MDVIKIAMEMPVLEDDRGRGKHFLRHKTLTKHSII